MAYCAGNIVGPQLFVAREAPSYTTGFLAITVCLSLGAATCLALRLHLGRENRARPGEWRGGDERRLGRRHGQSDGQDGQADGAVPIRLLTGRSGRGWDC